MSDIDLDDEVPAMSRKTIVANDVAALDAPEFSTVVRSLTGLPLILLAYAVRRIRYATLGLVQYLNPTLQFAAAVALFGEPFTVWHALAFALIWSGLALYSWQSWRQRA